MKKIIKFITRFIHKPLIVLPALFITGFAIGQNETPLNPKFKNIVKPESTKEWIYFKEDFKGNPLTIFNDLKDAFELSTDDQMQLKKTEKDNLGFTLYRYQQYYKNHQVLYGEYLIHQKSDGSLQSANGRLITGLNAGSIASVTEKQALSTALLFMNAAKYLWLNTAMEKELKRQEKNENATYYPKGELIYAPNNYNESFKASDYRLTWQFRIYTDDGKVLAKSVYVDALTSKVIFHTDIAVNCSGGTGTSSFNGNVSLHTEFSGSNYRSHNDCQPTDIYVYNCNRSGPSTIFYTDADNTWTQQSAVQAQWGAAQIYNYYHDVHGRTSWDNAASDMIVYNNAIYGNPPTSQNACWGCAGNAAIFGAGLTSVPADDWNPDDIMGHEFTHGVTQASANLNYIGESGALNESFSDIFGEMAESYSEGSCDYLEGADMSDGPIRSFINPKAYGQPGTYLGTNWFNTLFCTPDSTNDNCGVHTNSGVQNHWFYLLSEGGSGINDKGISYNVTGITRFKARLIAYRALTVYLNQTSQYIDARKASLQAAFDLYGQCSPEIIAVGDAWHAVGVESQSSQFTKNICGTYPQGGTFLQAISVLTAANGCSTEITPSATTVYFTARDQVILYPGFKADNGSNFVAYLEPCSSTVLGSTEPGIMSDAEKGIKVPVTYQTEPAKGFAFVTENISVAPNPFTSDFTLSINSKQNTKAQIIVYNSIGLKVKQQTGINLSKGLNHVFINCPGISQGVYMLEVDFDGLKMVKKIVRF